MFTRLRLCRTIERCPDLPRQQRCLMWMVEQFACAGSALGPGSRVAPGDHGVQIDKRWLGVGHARWLDIEPRRRASFAQPSPGTGNMTASPGSSRHRGWVLGACMTAQCDSVGAWVY